MRRQRTHKNVMRPWKADYICDFCGVTTRKQVKNPVRNTNNGTK